MRILENLLLALVVLAVAIIAALTYMVAGNAALLWGLPAWVGWVVWFAFQWALVGIQRIGRND